MSNLHDRINKAINWLHYAPIAPDMRMLVIDLLRKDLAETDGAPAPSLDWLRLSLTGGDIIDVDPDRVISLQTWRDTEGTIIRTTHTTYRVLEPTNEVRAALAALKGKKP